MPTPAAGAGYGYAPSSTSAVPETAPNQRGEYSTSRGAPPRHDTHERPRATAMPTMPTASRGQGGDSSGEKMKLQAEIDQLRSQSSELQDQMQAGGISAAKKFAVKKQIARNRAAIIRLERKLASL